MILAYDDFRFLFRHVSASGDGKVGRSVENRPFVYTPEGLFVAVSYGPLAFADTAAKTVNSFRRLRAASFVAAVSPYDLDAWRPLRLRYVYVPGLTSALSFFGETT